MVNSRRNEMVYGYIRVSTDKQTVENQRFVINRFFKAEKIKIAKWILGKNQHHENTGKKAIGQFAQARKRGRFNYLLNCLPKK
jgi:DNA invertase Pin-like site-specific DNA recombinase